MIHRFKIKDLCMVLDVNSGAVHLVDDLVYEILGFTWDAPAETLASELGAQWSKEAIAEAQAEIRELIEAGQLYSGETELDSNVLSRSNPVIKALCLHVAHDCNIRCKYCFAAQGSFEGARTLMSLETGKKALDFLIHHSGNRRQLEVDFFGGEPLMNFGVIKDLVTYGRELEQKHNKVIRFTMTTNGVLLNDEVIEYINREMHNLVLSIDGRPQVNDYMRETLNGSGTYDLIVPRFKKAIETRGGKSYYVRGTFTRHNLDFSKDVLHMADLGFDQVSVEPVVAPPDQDYALREEDIAQLCGEYETLAEAMLAYEKAGKGFNFFHFQIDLNQGPCIIKRAMGCGAGAEYVAITPEGEVYPCHQFVGQEDFRIGHVSQPDVLDRTITGTFSKAHVFEKEDCRSCWAKFYCSGGCHANAWHFNGTVLKPYGIGCALEKKRVECALYLKARRMMEVNA